VEVWPAHLAIPSPSAVIPQASQSIMTETEDERDIELASITAIFPELQIDPEQSHIATLEVEVSPATPLRTIFKPEVFPVPPPAADLRRPDATQRQDPIQYAQVAAAALAPPDQHDISYLSPLHLRITLPVGYPEEVPPSFEITSSSWLPQERLNELLSEGEKIWEEYGRSQVVYAYVDYLQQESEQAFGLKELILPHTRKAETLTYDKSIKRKKFEQETFACGVCLEPKKGSACYRLQRCGHVFCVDCLQDFYNSAITEGDVGTVKCLDPDCGRKNMTAEQRRKKKQRTLHPTELLEIPIETAQVQRYVDLKLKKKLESDKSTVYCPRTWCQGPAKSARYARYNTTNLESYPDSSDEEDEREGDNNPNGNEQPADGNNAAPPAGRYAYTRPPPDRLTICAKCEYAFCRICQRSWHGDRVNCLPRTTTELTAEEQASYDFIRLHTSACPTCNSPCQKTHGCNHMRCFQCDTHFCYLCGAYLLQGDPYRHFNIKESECFMKLWELEEGDEGEAAQGGGGRQVFNGARRAEIEAQHLREAEEMQVREFELAFANMGVATEGA